MKHLLTYIIVLFSFALYSQPMNWDQRYEKAKFDQRQGTIETYVTNILKEESKFTEAEYLAVLDHCADIPYIFKMEFDPTTRSIRFYHRSNVDGAFLMQLVNDTLGPVSLREGRMSAYKFDD